MRLMWCWVLAKRCWRTVSSLTNDLSSVPIKRASHCVDVHEMAMLVQRTIKSVKKLQCAVFRELQKTYDDMVGVVEPEIQEEFVNALNKTETKIQVQTARLEVNVEVELLWWSSYVQSVLKKSSALFSSRATKVIDVDSRSKSPSSGAKRA